MQICSLTLDMVYRLGNHWRLVREDAYPLNLPETMFVSTGTAGAGSLILEFGTLSRLTGDDRFEKAAYKAFFALWNRKSDIGLVGNTINTWTGVR